MIAVGLDRDVQDPWPAAGCICPSGEVIMQQLVRAMQLALGRDLPVLLTVNGKPARGVGDYRLDGPVAADPAFRPR